MPTSSHSNKSNRVIPAGSRLIKPSVPMPFFDAHFTPWGSGSERRAIPKSSNTLLLLPFHPTQPQIFTRYSPPDGLHTEKWDRLSIDIDASE